MKTALMKTCPDGRGKQDSGDPVEAAKRDVAEIILAFLGL